MNFTTLDFLHFPTRGVKKLNKYYADQNTYDLILLYADPDPAFFLIADPDSGSGSRIRIPDPDPGFDDLKLKKFTVQLEI